MESIRPSFDSRPVTVDTAAVDVDAGGRRRTPETFVLTPVSVRRLTVFPPEVDGPTQKLRPGLTHGPLADVEEDKDQKTL